MARGGARPGAGRKLGSATIKSRKIADRAARKGLMPLEVMLKAMGEHYKKQEWDAASAIAKDAAPYMHPKLASIEHGGAPDGRPIEFRDVTDEMRARALLAFLARNKITAEGK